MSLTAASYKNVNDEQVEALDQFLFRFSRLQDAMGQRLFPGVLGMLDEPVKEMPFLDRLSRLEQLRIIENKEQWLDLRNMRNKLAHEYENEPEAMSGVLNLVYASYQTRANIFLQVKPYVDKKIASSE